MEELSERLEVRLSPQTLRLLHYEARQRRVSIVHVVREAIDLLLRESWQARLRAAEALFETETPVADWQEMEYQIVQTHVRGLPN